MARVYTFTVVQPCTVKTFLRCRCGLSSRMVIRLKQEAAGITVNGEHARVIDPLVAGDKVMLRMPEENDDSPGIHAPVSVIWEDEDFLVIDKPAALPIHPSAGHEADALSLRVRGYYAARGEKTAFRPLYRLDKDTSGLVVAAKNSYAAAAASLEKTYFGVCEGEITKPGTIDRPIGLLPGHSIQRGCVDWGQPAVTHFEPVRTDGKHTLLRFRLETGRTHQIRVHMASIGHPLAGDDFYGGSLAQISRQALHCGEAVLRFPPLEKLLHFEAPFPEDLCRAFPALFD